MRRIGLAHCGQATVAPLGSVVPAFEATAWPFSSFIVFLHWASLLVQAQNQPFLPLIRRIRLWQAGHVTELRDASSELRKAVCGSSRNTNSSLYSSFIFSAALNGAFFFERNPSSVGVCRSASSCAISSSLNMRPAISRHSAKPQLASQT